MSIGNPPFSTAVHETPHKPAIVMSDGSGRLTFLELETRSHALAGALAGAGLESGDHVAILIENRPEFYVAAWAGHRLGLHYTPIPTQLTVAEIAYIAQDCGAQVLLTSPTLLAQARAIRDIIPGLLIWVSGADTPSGFSSLDGALPAPKAYEPLEGTPMTYSSGTSGRPKGVKRALSGTRFGSINANDRTLKDLWKISSDTVMLVASPLYHMAPFGFSTVAQKWGGTAVVMPRFDAQEALDAFAREKVTTTFLVPTMMQRILRLPEAQRQAADLSALKTLVHAAAPCPVEVKQGVIDWLGPVVYEFYAATEGNGLTMISSEEWLAHRGSVGRGRLVHIVGEDGRELPAGEVGIIYFENPNGSNTAPTFEYHNDPTKTAEATHPKGWTTIGDIGYLDAEGYLFLTDRKSHMIIAGGVNIYPQEAENVLSVHPKVADVAVIGVPHSEYGEEVKAVVELIDSDDASDALAQELIAYCQERLAKYKCPRSIDFVEKLPRTAVGKLLKREVRERYWPKAAEGGPQKRI